MVDKIRSIRWGLSSFI